MKSTGIYLASMLFIFIGACKVSKDVALPESAAPQTYRNGGATDSTGISKIEWRAFYTNADLQQLIDSTIKNNYDVQTALNTIRSARLVLKQSRLGNLPAASLQVSGAVNRPSDNSLNGISLSQFLGKSYIEDYSASAMLNWEADIWGKIRSQKAKALAAYLQTGEAKKAIQTNLVSYVASGYYNLLMLDAQVGIAKKNLALIDSTLSIIKLQYNAGQVTALAVQQTDAQRLEAALLIPQLEEEMVVQENALSVLAAVSPGNIKRSGTINDIAFADTLSAGIPSVLLQNRPDIKIKELQLDIANANTGIARANMYPSLTITATGGINAFKASNWFNIPASLFATAIGGLTQPLFQRKELKTKYELAKLERENSVIQFRQSVLTAVGEVSDALVKVDKLKKQEAIEAARVSILLKGVNNASLLFKNGMANYLEVITAQSNALQGELELAALKKQQSDAVVELYRSLGGGWK